MSASRVNDDDTLQTLPSSQLKIQLVQESECGRVARAIGYATCQVSRYDLREVIMVSLMSTSDTMPVSSGDDTRWAAVLQRDPSADGTFFYSVATTGVYCRPSCPSRRAKREHVRFHASAEAAERAGFRPCKRCRPNELPPAERNTALVAAACRAIEAADDIPSLNELATAAAMDRYRFHRVFKSVTGVTPKAYADACRSERVRDELVRGATVTDAIYAAGYNSGGRFYAHSSARLGMTPSDWRAGGAGAEIRFAVGQCTLGAILVAATDRGICAIHFGDDPEALVQALQERFSTACLVGDEPEFERLVARVVGLVETPGNTPASQLPLDIRGTAFQQRVWQALRQIPSGTTATYAEIARCIGQPRAARAVARACASNDIAVAIPCHRVVRTDGSLSGYRWGVERKQALLDREASA